MAVFNTDFFPRGAIVVRCEAILSYKKIGLLRIELPWRVVCFFIVGGRAAETELS